MFWVFVGYLLSSFGLSVLSYFSDRPGADRDSYFRNAGAAGGFLAILGLVSIFSGATMGFGSGALLAIIAALLTAASVLVGLRWKRRRRMLELVNTAEDALKTSTPPR